MRYFAVFVLAACAHGQPVGELRFKDRAPVWRVDDRTPLKEAPKKRDYNRTLYHADGYVFRRATRAMEVRPYVRAQDVNSLDEVPDSSWFENRIGVRELSLDELRQGANHDPSPFDHRPWKITGAKVGGMSIGFTFEDARGEKYILKFDTPDLPEMETGAHAIVHRILWAIGYHVPQDYIGYIERKDLVVGDKAKKKKFDEAKLDLALTKVARENDGRIRVLASKFLPGTVIGPYAREGKRKDDPNDVIAHENRRSLRGAYSIFAWLNHTDLQEDNTLDTFDDGHVTHYLIDFGKALGVMAMGTNYQNIGHTYRVDVGIAVESLLGLGLWKRPWDGLDAPGIRGVGLYDVEHYDPGSWRANSLYWPLEDKDRQDAFWGAKLLMRFTREQLAAIVDEAHYSDPRASQYMLDTLVARQRKTARYWFERVAPIDRVTYENGQLCFTDLLLSYKLSTPRTSYAIDTFDYNSKQLGATRVIPAAADGTACTAIAASNYTIVRLRVKRQTGELPPVVVHISRDRIIGLRRR